MPVLDPTRHWWWYPLVIVDFETTGVDPETCEPVSVAAARFEHGHEIGSYYSLIKPTGPIPAEASAIHGITDEHVADAPGIEQCAGELCKLAFDALPCAYNGTHFDRRIFHRYVWGTDCPLFDPAQRWLDPLIMIRAIDRYEPGRGRHKLERTCQRWGVPFEEGTAHNALADVRAVGRLLSVLVEFGKVKAAFPLGKLLDYSEAKAAEQQRDFETYLAKQREKERQQELSFDELDSTKAEGSSTCL